MDTYAAKLLILILCIICEINEEKFKKLNDKTLYLKQYGIS